MPRELPVTRAVWPFSSAPGVDVSSDVGVVIGMLLSRELGQGGNGRVRKEHRRLHDRPRSRLSSQS
jgi:hypothetical protein